MKWKEITYLYINYDQIGLFLKQLILQIHRFHFSKNESNLVNPSYYACIVSSIPPIQKKARWQGTSVPGKTGSLLCNSVRTALGYPPHSLNLIRLTAHCTCCKRAIVPGTNQRRCSASLCTVGRECVIKEN